MQVANISITVKLLGNLVNLTFPYTAFINCIIFLFLRRPKEITPGKKLLKLKALNEINVLKVYLEGFCHIKLTCHLIRIEGAVQDKLAGEERVVSTNSQS